VLKAAGETKSTQENIQDWLQLDEGDPGYQLLTEEKLLQLYFVLSIFISTAYSISFHLFVV
jgi:hypothetical protein